VELSDLPLREGHCPGSRNGAGTASHNAAPAIGEAAQFDYPKGVAVFGSGDDLLVYVADTYNNRIREITIAAGVGTVSTFAGSKTTAQFNHPSGVAVDSSGNVYVADTDGHRIRKITTPVNGSNYLCRHC